MKNQKCKVTSQQQQADNFLSVAVQLSVSGSKYLLEKINL